MGGPYKTEASVCRDRSDPGGAEASVFVQPEDLCAQERGVLF